MVGLTGFSDDLDGTLATAFFLSGLLSSSLP